MHLIYITADFEGKGKSPEESNCRDEGETENSTKKDEETEVREKYNLEELKMGSVCGKCCDQCLGSTFFS